MENFFHNDNFHYSLEYLIDEILDDNEIETLEELPDDYTIQVNPSKKERLVELSAQWIVDRIDDDRFTEDADETDKIYELLNECIDFKKFNDKVPYLYYELYKPITLTKQELIEWDKGTPATP